MDSINPPGGLISALRLSLSSVLFPRITKHLYRRFAAQAFEPGALYIACNPAAPLEIVEPARGIAAQGYAYAIRPGDVHLLNFLNTWIRSNQATGIHERTKTKWLDNFPG